MPNLFKYISRKLKIRKYNQLIDHSCERILKTLPIVTTQPGGRETTDIKTAREWLGRGWGTKPLNRIEWKEIDHAEDLGGGITETTVTMYTVYRTGEEKWTMVSEQKTFRSETF